MGPDDRRGPRARSAGAEGAATADPRPGGRALVQRVASAAAALPLLALVVGFAPPWLFAAFVLALVLRAQWELYRMFGQVGVVAHRAWGLLLGALVVLAFALPDALRPWAPPLALSLAVAASLGLGLRHGARPGAGWTAVALTLLGVCYCAWLLGHALWLRARADGVGLTFLLLAVTWVGETAAYLVGRRWGRRRLAPRISPRKTVEGAAAQVAASVLAALAVGELLAVAWPHRLAVGLLLGAVGQVGDLAESFLKRSAETKDAGELLPGHGGLLDRLDSLLFNTPALYYYVSVFSTLGPLDRA